MKTGANILWFVLGGWAMALLWLMAAVLMAISIIGLPWARACLEIAALSAWPFGKEVVSHSELVGGASPDLQLFRFIANLIWFPLGAILAILHVAHACVMFISIIGIPFGLQGLKLAAISLFPVGKRVVSIELAEAARSANAAHRLQVYRG